MITVDIKARDLAPGHRLIRTPHTEWPQPPTVTRVELSASGLLVCTWLDGQPGPQFEEDATVTVDVSRETFLTLPARGRVLVTSRNDDARMVELDLDAYRVDELDDTAVALVLGDATERRVIVRADHFEDLERYAAALTSALQEYRQRMSCERCHRVSGRLIDGLCPTCDRYADDRAVI